MQTIKTESILCNLLQVTKIELIFVQVQLAIKIKSIFVRVTKTKSYQVGFCVSHKNRVDFYKVATKTKSIFILGSRKSTHQNSHNFETNGTL